MNTFIKTISFALLASCAAAPAMAQQNPCLPREEAITLMQERYNEARVSAALTHDNNLLEMYVNFENGGWTLTITNALGVMCLVTHGNNYIAEDPSLPPNL